MGGVISMGSERKWEWLWSNRFLLLQPSEDEAGELEELREELDYSRRELKQRDKEMAEAKDRMTALENQIEEYAGTIDDQSRVSSMRMSLLVEE